MSNIGNQPVHPVNVIEFREGNPEIIAQDCGMTLRQHYAGLAMQGLLANVRVNDPTIDIADKAIEMADALIAALESK